jgi:hypothetical protein
MNPVPLKLVSGHPEFAHAAEVGEVIGGLIGAIAGHVPPPSDIFVAALRPET